MSPRERWLLHGFILALVAVLILLGGARRPGDPMNLRPISLREANAYVVAVHRHHGAVRGLKFAIGAEWSDGSLAGVAIVGRPVARELHDGYTAEVTRVATDGAPNACSMLYGAAWRAWRAMGGRRLVTYTLASEPGTSLRAAGARRVAETHARPNGWDAPGRRRVGISGPSGQEVLGFADFKPTPQESKVRWEWSL